MPRWRRDRAKRVYPETAIWSLTEDQIAGRLLERMKLPDTHGAFETPVADLDAKRRGHTPMISTANRENLRKPPQVSTPTTKMTGSSTTGTTPDTTPPTAAPTKTPAERKKVQTPSLNHLHHPVRESTGRPVR
mgnify:CR=1 FL=1